MKKEPIFMIEIQAKGFVEASVISEFCNNNELDYNATIDYSHQENKRPRRRKPRTTITEKLAKKINDSHRKNPSWTYERIGKEFGVSGSTAHRIITKSKQP